MICMTVRFWEYCRMKEILKLFLMPCFRFCTEGKNVKMTVKTFTVSPRYCLYTVVMGDIDDTTVHRGTKFSRYWYRRGHDTTGYFFGSATAIHKYCGPRYFHGTNFQILINNCYFSVVVPFLIAKYF